MIRRRLGAFLCVALVVAAAWVGGRGYGSRKPDPGWAEVAPDLWSEVVYYAASHTIYF